LIIFHIKEANWKININ